MLDANLHQPFYYSAWWGILGLILIASVAVTIGAIFYITRKKEIKKIDKLVLKEPKIVDLNALKEKYIGLINQVEHNYKVNRVSESVSHQQLSQLVRLFYYEARGFHAEVLTLRDIKKTNYDDLSKLIGDLYPDEFDTLNKGPVTQSAEKARKLVKDQ